MAVVGAQEGRRWKNQWQQREFVRARIAAAMVASRTVDRRHMKRRRKREVTGGAGGTSARAAGGSGWALTLCNACEGWVMGSRSAQQGWNGRGVRERAPTLSSKVPAPAESAGDGDTPSLQQPCRQGTVDEEDADADEDEDGHVD